jgi:hypothetical protein
VSATPLKSISFEGLGVNQVKVEPWPTTITLPVGSTVHPVRGDAVVNVAQAFAPSAPVPDSKLPFVTKFCAFARTPNAPTRAFITNFVFIFMPKP